MDSLCLLDLDVHGDLERSYMKSCMLLGLNMSSPDLTEMLMFRFFGKILRQVNIDLNCSFCNRFGDSGTYFFIPSIKSIPITTNAIATQLLNGMCNGFSYFRRFLCILNPYFSEIVTHPIKASVQT